MIRRSTGFLIVISDVIAISAAYLAAVYAAPYAAKLFLGEQYIINEQGRVYGHLNYFTTLALFALFMFYNRGHYTRRTPWWSQVQYVALTLIFALMVNGFILYSLRYSFSRASVFLSWIFAFFFILLGRQIIQLILEKLGKWHFSAVLIANTEMATDILYALSSDHYTGCRVNTLVLKENIDNDIDRTFLPKDFRDIIVASGVADYSSYIKKNPGEFYIISLDSLDYEDRDKIFDLMQKLNAEYVVIPPTAKVSLYGMEPQYFFGHDIMFLRPRYSIHSPLGRSIKRSIDLIASSILITLLLPFFPIVAFMIKKDGEKIFFKSPRIGFRGKPFMCWKFRTMVPDAARKLEDVLSNDPNARDEYDKFKKLQDDPRITKIGKLLRKASIDELPQLINVLKGEMSLVGPRPILKSERDVYGEPLTLYKTVKPGITGLWQVSGRNEATFGQRVYFDKWYIQNWSIWHDFVILLKTVHTVFFRSGAY